MLNVKQIISCLVGDNTCRKIMLLILLGGVLDNVYGQSILPGSAPNISYTASSQIYTANTPISPLIPTNAGDPVPATVYGQVATFAGSVPGNAIGTTATAKFAFATGVAADISNNIYIADYENNVIKKISSAGIVTTLAGSGTQGLTDGTGVAASFFLPVSLAVDASGNVYVADFSSSLIRKITPVGVVTTFAGSTPGFANGTGTGASFKSPVGLAVDNSGNIFVADRDNNLIRKITPVGVVTTFAGSGIVGSANGTGASASFKAPENLAFDDIGNLYVTEFNNLVRKITPLGEVTTIAGSGNIGSVNGIGTAASFYYPIGIVADHAGNIYVGDQNNHLIRKITSTGVVTTLAGNGSNSLTNGIGALAGFSNIYSLAIDNICNIYVADAFSNSVIRKVVTTGYTIDKPLPTGLIFDPTTGTISGTPTMASATNHYTITAYNAGGSSSTVVNIAVNTTAVTLPVAAPNISYVTPQTYAINTTISTLAPANTGGVVPPAIYGQVSTFANGGFNTVTGVATDAAGNVYVDDWSNNKIKKIDITTGVISIIAGSSQGAANGQGAAASFFEPDGIALDPAGNIYIGDQGNNLIRKITPSGLVTTLAGSGVAGAVNATGIAASFYGPRGLAIDAAGNLYLADQANNMIRKITPAGVVTTVAGRAAGGFTNGTVLSATFNSPTGVGIDATGNLYIADAGNNAIRKITPAGAVTTYATGFNFPREVRVDGTGNCYVTEQNSNTIKRISSTGVVTTIAGTGQTGATNGNGNVATFNGPIGLILDGYGNLYEGDSGNNLVRKVVISGYTIDKTLPAGLIFDPTTGKISGTPAILSPATDYIITAYNGGGSSTTVVNIAVSNTALPPSIITFPIPVNTQIGANGILVTGVTSNNAEVPVTYTSSNPSVAYIGTDGLVHVIAPGVVIITASQAASAHYSAATPVARTYTIMATQTIDFPAISTKTTCSADFFAGATAHYFGYPLSNIPITYSSSNPTVATVSATTGLIHILTTGTTVITANQAGNTLYYAAAPQSQTLTVTLPVLPAFSMTVNNSNACVGSLLTFKVILSNSVTLINPSYQWQVNGTSVASNSDTYSTNTITQTDLVKCTITNNDLCVTTTNVTLSNIILLPVNALVVSIQSSATGAVCSGTPVIFTATPNYGGTNTIYQWQINGINVGSNSTTYTSSSLVNGDAVTCTFTNNSAACFTSRTVSSSPIIVNNVAPVSPLPSVIINASANNVYAGMPITFTATPVNAIGGINYQWQVNGVNAGTNSAVFIIQTLANGDKVTCTILTGNGCIPPAISLPVTVTVLPPLAIIPPNTFTPNGDGVNDLWNITGLVTYPNCLVTVYNRYGTVVFQSKGYNKPWDGLYKGSNLPVGTYYYVIDLANDKPKVSGYLAIIR